MVVAAGPCSALKSRRRFLRSGLRSFRANRYAQSAGCPHSSYSQLLTPDSWLRHVSGRKQYYLDQEIALYLLGAGNNGRYYDAAAGRFLSEDPTKEAGGDADLFLPKTEAEIRAMINAHPLYKAVPGKL